MDLSGVPLAELRRRLAAAEGSADHARLLARLCGDARCGARELGERSRRRIARREAEAERIRCLLARRDALVRSGARCVAGVDEVGMGPLAGPVVAAAVVLPARVDLPGLTDSKRLARGVRERLAAAIREQAEQVAVAEVPPEDVDRLNVHRAGLLAMARAVGSLSPEPDQLLVDARTIPGVRARQIPLVQGDARDASIAAASIVAKVYRDAIMVDLHQRYPGYGFDRHMGYGTREHLGALLRLGPSPVHRRSFAPVARAARCP